MKILFPIRSVDGVNWETLLSELPLLEKRNRALTMIAAEDVPEKLRNTPISRIIYLGGEVLAL